MATITAARRTYKDSGYTTDCLCMRITRADGTVLRFTDAYTDLTISNYNNSGTLTSLGGDVTYLSTHGLDISAFGARLGQPGQIDVEGMLLLNGVLKSDILSGKYYKARVVLFWTDWSSPVQDDEVLCAGFFGEVTFSAGRYVLKMGTLLDVMEVDTTDIMSYLCPVKFGSTLCGVSLTASAWQATTAYTAIESGDRRVGSIVKPTAASDYWHRCTTAGTSGGSEPTWPTTVDDTVADDTVVWTTIKAMRLTRTVSGFGAGARSLTFLSNLPSGFEDWLANGYASIVDGPAAGEERRIVSNTLSGCTLDAPLVNATTNGNTVTLVAGCLKSHSDCITHDNFKNDQSFYMLPGMTNIYRRGVA